METKNWKWFLYKDIFNITTYRIGDNVINSKEGKIPYIGASCTNNGITSFVSSENTICANKITVARNGSVGCAFYQSSDFVVSPDDIRLFELKEKELNPYIALFLCVLIEKEKYRYAYGRKFGTKRMEQSEIKLPINKKGNPDWLWIETFVKEKLVTELPPKAKAVWFNNFDEKPLSNKRLQLNTENWKWFEVGNVLTCETTMHSIQQEMSKGKTPFVTRSAVNNGISDYVFAEPYLINENNCITIGAEGLFAFYQPQNFITGVKVYTLRHKKMNQFNAMFLCAILNREVYRYNYGNARILAKIQREKIKLPATADGAPDWQFMEDYIKGLPYSGCL